MQLLKGKKSPLRREQAFFTEADGQQVAKYVCRAQHAVPYDGKTNAPRRKMRALWLPRQERSRRDARRYKGNEADGTRGAKHLRRARCIVPVRRQKAFGILLFGCGGFFFFFGFFLGGGSFALLFFFLQLGADEFEDSEFGTVSNSPTGADYSGVTARAVGEARRQIREKLLCGDGSHQESGSLTPGVKRIALAERDHAFGKRARGLGAKERGMDALLFDQISDQITKHRTAMGGLLPEFRT